MIENYEEKGLERRIAMLLNWILTPATEFIARKSIFMRGTYVEAQTDLKGPISGLRLAQMVTDFSLYHDEVMTQANACRDRHDALFWEQMFTSFGDKVHDDKTMNTFLQTVVSQKDDYLLKLIASTPIGEDRFLPPCPLELLDEQFSATKVLGKKLRLLTYGRRSFEELFSANLAEPLVFDQCTFWHVDILDHHMMPIASLDYRSGAAIFTVLS